MRDLVRMRTFLLAGPAGLAIALCCVPFVVAVSRPGTLRLLQLGALPLLSMLLMQISIAWTPHRRPQEVLATFASRRSAAVLVGIGVTMSCLAGLLVDPVIGKVLPGYFPRSMEGLLLSLPWIGLFQPLFMVASVYAFAYRLTRRPLVGVALVILAHQGVLLLQVGQVSAGLLPVLLLFAGVYGLVLGWSYRAHGLCGPAVIAVLSQVRHAFRFF